MNNEADLKRSKSIYELQKIIWNKMRYLKFWYIKNNDQMLKVIIDQADIDYDF